MRTGQPLDIDRPPDRIPECLTPGSAHRLLKRDGFVSLGKHLGEGAVSSLRKEADRLLDEPAKPWRQYRDFAEQGVWESSLFAEDGRVSAYFDCIGQSPEIDALLEQLLAKPEIGELLTRVLGSNQRIWYATIRRDQPGANALRMHRDKPGEVGLSILLDDVPSLPGTTVFWRGSHRWPAMMDCFPRVYPKAIRRFLAGSTGSAGEVYLFYNATWHGRLAAETESKTALIVTFLPESESTQRRPPLKVVESVGPVLRALLTAHAPTQNQRHSSAAVGPDSVVGGRTGSLLPCSLGSLVAPFRSLLKRGAANNSSHSSEKQSH